MDGDADEQHGPHGPKRGSKRLEEMRITVDLVGILEHLEIADQVARDKAHQHDTGHGHQELAADRGFENVSEQAHRKFMKQNGAGFSTAQFGL